MAPPKGARKAPAVRPAMPLPHVKRQAAAAAAKNKTASHPESEAKGATSPQHGSPSTTKSSTSQTGSPTSAQVNASVKSSVATVNGQRPLAGGESPDKQRRGKHSNICFLGAKLSPLPHEKEMPAVSPKPTNAGPNLEVNGHRSQDSIDRTPKPSQPAAPVEAESRQEAPKENAAKPSVSIPTSQPMRHMAPPFQPANRPESGIGNANQPPRPPIVNGHPHMHRPHPSNASGNLHFGAFHDSTGSSPAPPHSGGVAPPPGVPAPDGRQSWMPPAAGGYPPNLPSNLDMMGANKYEVYGRPDLAYAHMDPYGHYGNSFAPSTPQSFHESTGSAHPDNAGQFHAMASSTPHHGPTDSVNSNAAAPMGPQYDHYAPTINRGDLPAFDQHSSQFFNSPELADCTIEFRFMDSRTPPFRMPGHRFVLSRSPTLHDLIRQQARQSNSNVLVLQADDHYVDSHTFYMALQFLYGLPLFDPPALTGTYAENLASREAAQRNCFALCYAGAGRILGCQPVVRRGCHIAARILNEATVEHAFAFAVDGHEDRGTYEKFKWGDGSRILLDAILAFTVASLPAEFSFDAGALGSPSSRLPYDIPSPTAEILEPTSPVILGGSGLGHHRGALSQNQHIQFGDLALNDDNKDQGAQQISPFFRSTLSRIMVNLPFGYLKLLLEDKFPPTAKVDGQARLRIVQDVVKEREARRERAIEAVKLGTVPDADKIRASLATVEPSYTGRWSVLGWVEEVVLPAGGAGPTLRRQWVPLKNENRVSEAAYP